MRNPMENPGEDRKEESVQLPADDIDRAKEFLLFQAEGLIRKRKDTDIDYAAEAVKLIVAFEDYRRATRKIFSRLGSDLREKSERKIEEINRRLNLGIGKRRTSLSLAEALEMPELGGDKARLGDLFRTLFRQAHMVAQRRNGLLENQKAFRDTNDAILRTFMTPSKEISEALGNEPLREARIDFPVDPDLFLEEVSEAEYERGKDMPPTDRTILEAIRFVEDEANNVPQDFLVSNQEKKT